MDNNSEVPSVSCNDSVFAGVTKYNEDDIPKEISLLRHLQQSISETTEEKIAYTKEITTLLSKLDLDIKALPNDIKEGLEKFSSILKTEKLFEFDETTLQVIRQRKIIEEKKRQRQEKEMSLNYDKLFRKYTRLQSKLDHLQDAVNTVMNDIDVMEEDKNNMHCNKVFLSTKLNEYQQATEKLEADLNDMGVNEFYSEEILNKYKLYLEKMDKLADINQSLVQYGDLPPNLLQAKLLVESKKKEYESLEEMFQGETE